MRGGRRCGADHRELAIELRLALREVGRLALDGLGVLATLTLPQIAPRLELLRMAHRRRDRRLGRDDARGQDHSGNRNRAQAIRRRHAAPPLVRRVHMISSVAPTASRQAASSRRVDSVIASNYAARIDRVTWRCKARRRPFVAPCDGATRLSGSRSAVVRTRGERRASVEQVRPTCEPVPCRSVAPVLACDRVHDDVAGGGRES